MIVMMILLDGRTTPRNIIVQLALGSGWVIAIGITKLIQAGRLHFSVLV